MWGVVAAFGKKLAFETVRHAKPSASHQDSGELYFMATGFRGNR